MIGNRVRNDAEKFFLGVDRSDREAVQELNHKTGETLEGTWNSDGWADLDKDTLGCVDINLKSSSLVDRGIEEGEKTLR